MTKKKTKSNSITNNKEDLLQKSKKALLKFIECMNIFSAWVTFILDWTIFFICFASIVFLLKVADNIDYITQSVCLDYDTYGQLKAFKIIILGVAFQSYEIMFLVLVRLFLIIISLGYMYFTKGKISWIEFSVICCDDKDDEEENEDEEKEEDPNLKKVDTIKNANIDKKVAETEYQKNLKEHKKSIV